MKTFPIKIQRRLAGPASWSYKGWQVLSAGWRKVLFPQLHSQGNTLQARALGTCLAWLKGLSAHSGSEVREGQDFKQSQLYTNARAVKCLIQAGCLSAWVALGAVKRASEDGSGPGKEEAITDTQGRAMTSQQSGQKDYVGVISASPLPWAGEGLSLGSQSLLSGGADVHLPGVSKSRYGRGGEERRRTAK